MSNPAEECDTALKIEYDTRYDRVDASMQAERENDLAYARKMELDRKLKKEFEMKFEELKLKIASSPPG